MRYTWRDFWETMIAIVITSILALCGRGIELHAAVVYGLLILLKLERERE